MCDMYHPSYQDIQKLGCGDPLCVSTTFYVYIELCEAKAYWDVQYKYQKDLDLLYLEVRREKHSSIELCIPWPTTYDISLDKIEKIQKGLNSKSITFIFKSEDSTSVMYKVSEGLVKPLAPQVSKQMKEKEEKKFELNREIKRNTCYLYELAMSLNNQKEDTSESKATSVATDKDTSIS